MPDLQPIDALLPDHDQEDAAAFFLQGKALQAWVKRQMAAWEEMLVEWFEANPGKALKIGDQLIFLGEKKSRPKPKDVTALLEAILMHTAGELERVTEFLTSSPVKYGEVKSQMGEEAFEQHFEVAVSSTVKEGKRPPKGIQVVNTKYVGDGK